MELEALQLPVSDLQGLDLQPPVSPPDQVVSRLRGGQSFLGGCTCSANCQAVNSVGHCPQLAQLHIL
jgi:hypothetical protein